MALKTDDRSDRKPVKKMWIVSYPHFLNRRPVRQRTAPKGRDVHQPNWSQVTVDADRFQPKQLEVNTRANILWLINDDNDDGVEVSVWVITRKFKTDFN